MKAIYKYKLNHEMAGYQKIKIPALMEVKKVEVQYKSSGRPVLWILVDTENKEIEYEFVIRTTGSSIEEDDIYIGTYFHENSFGDKNYVYHVFQKRTRLNDKNI
jgi:hypothetical protein